jgi:osmotically-inducible protein OsmY
VKYFWIVALGALVVACAQTPKKEAAPKASFRALGEPVPTEIARADESIGFDVRHQIDLAGPTDLAGVVVVVEDGVVTLRGSVTSRTSALRAEGAARVVKGVKAVVDQIQILQTGPVTY